MEFKLLPKIELHHHLDCGLSFEAAQRLEPTLTRAQFEAEFIAPPKCANLAEYLKYPPRTVSLLQTEKALRVAVADLFAQYQAENVIYAEIRFAPLLHCEGGLEPAQVVDIVDKAVKESIRFTGIDARIILCTLRHFTAEQGLVTAELVGTYGRRLVVALDMAGGEADYPIAPHVPAFEYARRRGLHVIAHAGEALGAESIWETLEMLEPERLGHGVRAIEDPALVTRLADRHIHLEICPSTNVQINIFPTLADHPINALYHADVSVGINTDTRTLTNVSLTHEYRRLHETFGWGLAELGACNLNALQASFAPDRLKSMLEPTLRNAYRL